MIRDSRTSPRARVAAGQPLPTPRQPRCRQTDILELGTAMAVISGMAKLSFVLNLVEKENYCPFAGSAADAA